MLIWKLKRFRSNVIIKCNEVLPERLTFIFRILFIIQNARWDFKDTLLFRIVFGISRIYILPESSVNDNYIDRVWSLNILFQSKEPMEAGEHT